MMGVLKAHCGSLRFEHTIFRDALTMVGAEVEVKKTNMKVETSSMSTRSAASPKLKALWFLRIGRSRTSEDYSQPHRIQQGVRSSVNGAETSKNILELAQISLS